MAWQITLLVTSNILGAIVELTIVYRTLLIVELTIVYRTLLIVELTIMYITLLRCIIASVSYTNIIGSFVTLCCLHGSYLYGLSG